MAGATVPSLDWFIYAFVRKEAVLSSQIEGTQATLVDLLTFEALQECATTSTRSRMPSSPKSKDMPLSMRLLNQTHQRLMRGVRGSEKLAGEVRRSQNRSGGSRPRRAVRDHPPYLDGTGRIVRLLVSLSFKRHRDDYYRRLNAVRVEGDRVAPSSTARREPRHS